MCEIIGDGECEETTNAWDKTLLMYVNLVEHTLSFKTVFNVNKKN